MGRTIGTDIVKRSKRDPEKCVIKYLEGERTKTARELAKKAVVGLWPESILGEVIWLRGASAKHVSGLVVFHK